MKKNTKFVQKEVTHYRLKVDELIEKTDGKKDQQKLLGLKQ